MQVDVEVLGAHLEAYADTLPTVNELRLCNRFGKGPHAAIARLPPELVGIIEEYLVSEERNRLFSKWKPDFRCHRLLCAPVDHVTKEVHAELLRKIRTQEIKDSKDYSSAEDSDELRVEFYLADHFEDWCETHWDRGHSWLDRVGMQSAHRRGIFSEHEVLLKKHFGLAVWISHLRLESAPYESYWEDCDFDIPHTTVAYLTLPGSTRHFKAPALTEDGKNDKEFFIECGYGMPVHIPPPLSHSATNRFKRMMQILDLRPYNEPSQMDLELYANGETTAALELRKRLENEDGTPTLPASSEPKLTMLVRHIVRSDEYE